MTAGLREFHASKRFGRGKNLNRSAWLNKDESDSLGQGCEGVQRNGNVRLAGVSGRRSIVTAYRNRNRIRVCMNYGCFAVVVPVVAWPYVHMLVGRH